jgi:hypothetical protein
MKNKIKERIIRRLIKQKLGKNLEEMSETELAETESSLEKFLLEHNPSKLIELQKKYKKGIYSEEKENENKS